jgi:hypothetical protein
MVRRDVRPALPLLLALLALGCGDTLNDPAQPPSGEPPPPGGEQPAAPGEPRALVVLDAPERIELSDSITVTVTAWDQSNRVGITEVGFVAIIRDEPLGTERVLTEMSSPAPRPAAPDTTTASFVIRPSWVAEEDLPARFQIELYGLAFDSTGACGAALLETPDRVFECVQRAVAGDSVLMGEVRPLPVQVEAVAGRTVPFPSPTLVLGDLQPDTLRGRAYLSNRLANRLHVLQPDAFAWLPDVSVGSEPWGLHLNRTGDTLIVSNSGGTSLSYVTLTGTPREVVARRLQTRNTALFEFDFLPSRADPADTLLAGQARFLDFSDRPQYVAQDGEGRLLYSTRPTFAAPLGTVRVIENRPGWEEPETRILARIGEDVVPDTLTAVLIHIDSITVYDDTGFVVIWDHVPGFPSRAIRSDSLPPFAALRQVVSRGSDAEWRLDRAWDLSAVSFADTTYVAASRDRSYIAFGDGGEPSIGRVLLWETGTGTISSRLTVADLVNNASERVTALELNRDGSLGLARGSFGTYFFSNDLRLRGTVPEITAGGGGVALHPDHPDTPAPVASSPVTLAFTMSGDRSIRIIDTVHYGERGRIRVRDPIRGPLRVTPPFPADNGGQGRNCAGPDCVVAKVFAVTSEGVLLYDVRARDIQGLP